jgi:hypothetical protein
MANYRPFDPVVQAAFEAGQLAWDSPVRDLKYIGPYLEGRMNNFNIFTIADLVQYLLLSISQNANNDIILDAFQAIAPIVFNANAQRCKQNYLSRPLNRMGFNVIADVLQYARLFADWPDEALDATLKALPLNIGGVLCCNFNERLQANPLGPNNELPATYCNKIPMYGNVGSDMASLRSCPCTLNPDACQGDCMWVPGMPGEPGACISRVASYDRGNHVLDEQPFPGDWYPENEYPPSKRDTARYVPVPPGPGRYGYMFALPVQKVFGGKPPDTPKSTPSPIVSSLMSIPTARTASPVSSSSVISNPNFMSPLKPGLVQLSPLSNSRSRTATRPATPTFAATLVPVTPSLPRRASPRPSNRTPDSGYANSPGNSLQKFFPPPSPF